MDLVILFNPDCSQSLCVFVCTTEEKKKKKLTANMEPVKQDGAPTHTTSLERWRWGKGAVERFSKRRAIFCDFRGGAEGAKKKPFPPPTPQRRVHDPSSSARTPDQYSLNRPELSTSLSSSAPPPPDPSASSISSPVFSPSGASMPATSPRIALSSSKTRGPWNLHLPLVLGG